MRPLADYDTDKLPDGWVVTYDFILRPGIESTRAVLEFGIHGGGSLEVYVVFVTKAGA